MKRKLKFTWKGAKLPQRIVFIVSKVKSNVIWIRIPTVPNYTVSFMNRRAVLIIICEQVQWVSYKLANQKMYTVYICPFSVWKELIPIMSHSIIDHHTNRPFQTKNFSSLSSSKMSSNGTSNDNCITCKQPVRPRQEGLQCDGCQKWNHRTCNTGM